MRRVVAPLLAVTVALVLADSAVVTLALPDILQHLDASVTEVAWVLISFNLVLGVAAVPSAALLRWMSPRVLGAVGIAAFAGASAWCAAAGSIEILILARCIQALGGALALVACLELMVAVWGRQRGVAIWIGAGVVGTAFGPVAGGLLTQAISWQAIFVVQVPFAVLAVPAALAIRIPRTPPPPERHRPALLPNLTLALLSAALTAALFLLVLLLVEGWRHSPATAAVTVSVVAIAALVSAPLARLLAPPVEVEVATGCLLVAGGLAGLALLPSSHLGWTIAPQALVGLGLGLTVDRLTVVAMEMRLPRPRHAAWTISARHLGVVLGLLILTPVFTHDLQDAEEPAQEAITSLVIDAPLKAEDKIALARRLSDELEGQRGQVPDLHPAFEKVKVEPREKPALADLEAALTLQLERAATHAFRDSFLIGGGLALLALLTVLIPRRRTRAAMPPPPHGPPSPAPPPQPPTVVPAPPPPHVAPPTVITPPEQAP
ncbi:MFS transporter [Nocardioides sp. GXZ039]|uniref:MFS transporter n=1 Tax=Nocardioides sp. GXZ039 TaxID=3136018 RepID=UPI0030F4126D